VRVSELGAPAVAIIGMACRLPGAEDVKRFWENLRDGVESISDLTDAELLAAGVDPALLADPCYVKRGGILAGADLFDAAYFGYSPREAEILDPQQRVFLECAVTALENAGHGAVGGLPVGVFAGASLSHYLIHNLYGNREIGESAGALQGLLGNDKDFLATRVAYELDLKGPAITVQTACSTSLVAVHLACRSLLGYECDLALAGGVSVASPLRSGYLYQEGGVMAPDGRCRAFDAAARGTVNGNGVAIVVLKRLEDALADADAIRAVIRGTAINNDGAAKVGFTAPSVSGQAAVILAAQAVAGVRAEEITYVEAHGTGTELGDSVEVAALSEVFRAGTQRRQFCAIGSVKTNVGHLDAAAGAAGLIKTVLALEHRLLPPSLHFERPNPEIDFAASPFRVNAALAPWEAGSPRRAGVSSFGLGGTNAHAVLAEAPPPAVPEASRKPWHLLALSAHTPEALDHLTADLAGHLAAHPGLDLADVAFTLAAGRRRLACRRALVASSTAAAAALASRDPRRLPSARAVEEPAIVFLFPGGGAQHAAMGSSLYAAEPAFRAEIDPLLALLAPLVDFEPASFLHSPEQGQEAARQLLRPSVALPLLFAVELALARLWMRWGVRPVAAIGHSLGEYVAACLSGVFSAADGLALVLERGRLFERLPAGAMLGVALAEEEVRPWLGAELSIAAVNGPGHTVVSGPAAAIGELAVRVAAAGAEGRRVRIDVAAHSPLVEPILPAFRQFVRGLALAAPSLPYVSNVSGTWVTAAQATDPDYWTQHLRRPVRFADGLGEILRSPNRLLLEVGPGQALSSLARLQEARPRAVLSSLPHPRDARSEAEFLHGTAGALWLAGAPVDLAALYAGERRRRLPLPTYPFERRRFWVEPSTAGPARAARGRKVPDVGRWLYLPGWRRTPPPQPEAVSKPRSWLLFLDGLGVGERLAERLAFQGLAVDTVLPGSRLARLGARAWTIDPRPESFRGLVAELCAEGRPPQAVVHLRGLGGMASGTFAERFDRAQERGYYSVLFLAQALAARDLAGEVVLTVVADGLLALPGREIHPEKAPVLGLLKVLSQESSGLLCRAVDLPSPAAGQRRAAATAEAADRLWPELHTPPLEPVVAYHGGRRWVPSYEPAPLAPIRGERPRRLRPRGVYLITGGLGRVGLLLAEHLARRLAARLLLAGRRAPGPAELARLQALRALGSEVEVIQADVADLGAASALVARAEERFGRLDGVFHAAGMTRGRSIFRAFAELGREESEEQFRPKALGAAALASALGERRLDFCLLFSSNAAVLGGLGFAAYAAANSALEAFAACREGLPGTPWIAASWDGWGADDGGAAAVPGPRTSMDLFAMTPQEALEAIERLLDSSLAGPCVVSTGDLAPRLALWVRREDALAPAAGSAPGHSRPDLKGPYEPPGNELERRIAAIWEELLGVAPIGIYDNFFELGGHSLLATRLLTRLREAFAVKLPLPILFEGPFVADLAVKVAEALGGEEEAAGAVDDAPRDAVAVEEAGP
jgi:phthiocerol/phenolphthiocerol synthesis type-I polyketide synthase E